MSAVDEICCCDVVVVGAGHAGAEAAHAAAKLGTRVVLLTISIDTIAQMSCNPAIGGLAKGQIVREIDALGGLMAQAIDATGIQFRMLNRSKGPAVWAPRAQADKSAYQQYIRQRLEECENLTIIADTAVELLTDGSGRATGLLCRSGRRIAAKAVVLTTGTFLRGLIHIGEQRSAGGRYGEPASEGLSESLARAGIELGRLKTGTPPRLAAESIDCRRLQEQPGDAEPVPFSFMNDQIDRQQISCWITYTNEKTHRIIRENLDKAPLYTGQITSLGPRYCPSIETKIVRFADKNRHQLFLEPQGPPSVTNWVYVNGISTSLPQAVQNEMIHSIEGLERAEILQYGYAIEYDYVPPLQIFSTLECKKIAGLFMAGQINGTSGYEEAAGLGLIAGVNAARKVNGQEPVTLGRHEAYIGVMIDDCVTKGIDEPYRMFTSRAEYRLLLRADNADQRLTPIGRKWGLLDDSRWERFQKKLKEIKKISNYLCKSTQNRAPMDKIVRRQDKNVHWLLENVHELAEKSTDLTAIETVVNDIRYSGYIAKQQRLIERFKKAESRRLPSDLDYSQIGQLRSEAKEKLNVVKPINLGQASRISGINPADIAVLMVQLEKMAVGKDWGQ